MRIARVSIGYPPRRCGWSHHAFNLSRQQALLGHQVWVFHCQGPQRAALPASPARVEEVRLGPLARFWERWWVRMLFAFLASIKIWRSRGKAPFDLIHAHGDIFEALPLIPLARILRIPLLFTVHSGLSRRRRYRLAAPWVWPRVSGCIAQNSRIAQDLESLRVEGGKIAVISSGVDLERISSSSGIGRDRARSRLGLERDDFVIVAAGRLAPVKGFHCLIEAFRLLPAGSRATLLIIGDGPLREELARAAAGCPGIRLIGERPQEEVFLHLRAADLFVLPSVDLQGHAEATPTAVMEAMAAGLPVVVSDSGGAKDVIEGVPGVSVVAQADPAALSGAIASLMRDPPLRERLGCANLARARQKDWPIIAAQVCAFYAKIQQGSR